MTQKNNAEQMAHYTMSILFVAAMIIFVVIGAVVANPGAFIMAAAFGIIAYVFGWSAAMEKSSSQPFTRFQRILYWPANVVCWVVSGGFFPR